MLRATATILLLLTAATSLFPTVSASEECGFLDQTTCEAWKNTVGHIAGPPGSGCEPACATASSSSECGMLDETTCTIWANSVGHIAGPPGSQCRPAC